jgi:uncharacterized repeat protein (TIGR03803 family)
MLYGTTTPNYVGGYGHIYRVNTDGSDYQVIKYFNGTDGDWPLTELVADGDTLYGTTEDGGANPNSGTVFKINTDGTGFSILHDFAPIDYQAQTNADGAGPLAGMTLIGGTLYGTTDIYGPLGGGTIFKMDTNGSNFTTLYSFSSDPAGTNGRTPCGTMLLVGDTLYGTTSYGGTANLGTVFKISTNGTGFTVLHQLGTDAPNATSGSGPQSGPLLVGNTLYGTVPNGGPGFGFFYRVNTDGTGYCVLHYFGANGSSGPDGGLPLGGLVLNGGKLYGTSVIGGSNDHGTLFSYDLHAAPNLSCVGSNGAFVLSWSAIPGNSYQVQHKEQLCETNWSNIASPFTATDNVVSVTNSMSPGAGFYRVVMLAE